MLSGRLAATLSSEAQRGQIIGTVMSGLLLGVLLSRPAGSLVAGALGWRAVLDLQASGSAGSSLTHDPLHPCLSAGGRVRLLSLRNPPPFRCARGAFWFTSPCAQSCGILLRPSWPPQVERSSHPVGDRVSACDVKLDRHP